MVYLDNASTTYPKPECVYAETMKQLATRTWARGLVASYAYDASGKLLSLDYSDTTPDIAYTYDRLGRQLSAIAAGVSTNYYAYSRYGQLTNETVQGLVTASLARATDSLGRATGFSVAGVGGPSSPYAVTYGYDTYGRFSSVSSSVDSVSSVVNYSYLSGSDLVSGMTASSGHSWSRSYEPARSLITAVENRFGNTVISRFDYVNDGIGRRVSRVDSGQAFQNPAFDVYSYNTRSEVSGAQRYHGTNPADTSRPFGGRGFGYDYDPIGNRLSASETVGGETLTKGYTANALNQYTSIANPDAVALRGVATNTATVTVNGNAATRDSVVSTWTPWHHALPTDNANGGVFTFAEIMAAINPPGTNTPDLVSTASGHVYAPPQAEVLTYDDDGNLVSDGRWQYTWNGENRLIKAEELLVPPMREPYVVEYAYDHRGRMIWKTVASPNTPPVKAIIYLWDDYNIITEAIAQDNATTTTYNIWGLDLDGTLQGAGGVGGLLAVVKDSATYIPDWDANGNIIEYSADDGTIVAHREYDPFGGTVVATGDVGAFTHWFSTKPWCSVTGLSEYQYRKYSPALGRWVSRDPMGENGCLGQYCLNNNNSLTTIDTLGLLPSVNAPVGTVAVTCWNKIDKTTLFLNTIGWSVCFVWFPPADWKEDCPPCTKAGWIQDWSRTVIRQPGIFYSDTGWVTDWNEYSQNYLNSGFPWVNGQYSRGTEMDKAILSDEPFFETAALWTVSYYESRHRASLKCFEGDDAGKLYFTIIWGFTWDPPRFSGIGPYLVTPEVAGIK